MKKMGAVVLAAIVFVVVGGLDEAWAQSVRIGFKGGYVWSELSAEGEDEVAFERRSGWAAGGFFALGGGSIVVQPEGLYVRRGAEIVGPGLAEGEAKVTLDYLEVPLLLKVSSARPGTSPNLFFGPYAAFKIEAKTEIGVGDTAVEEDVSDEFEDIDYGIVAGAGVDFGKLGLEARYTLGLADLTVDDAAELKHRSLAVMASFTF